jgi:hypothetical protein
MEGGWETGSSTGSIASNNPNTTLIPGVSQPEKWELRMGVGSWAGSRKGGRVGFPLTPES